MKLQPGTEVSPNVRLERRLATGAMGSVWLAEHTTLNTSVAVKFISERLDPDNPEVLERFVREASTAAQIKSSHVVQTFDQGVMRDGTAYIVMEYLEGEGLGHRLTRGGRLPVDMTMRIVAQTAKALGSAHKLDIVHRDIKPDNIFLSMRDDELHVKVFDFGIAKHRQDSSTSRRTFDPMKGVHAEMGLTNDGVMIGTPEYMSPEQVMSASSVDHHADLWGLAVVAYACLTGKLPFTGADVGELCVNLLEGRFVHPSSLRPELSRELDAWFAKAFARKSEDRFQTAREMSQTLRLALPLAWSAEMEEPRTPYEPLAMPAAGAVEVSPLGVDGGRGIRAATFSGTETDTARLERRRRSAIGGALALGVVAVGAAVAVWASGGEDKTAARGAEARVETAPGAQALAAAPEAAQPPVAAPHSPVPAVSAEVATTNRAASTPRPPPRVPPRTYPPRPGPKNPGF